jgi:pimeloyl-ACP methyl ester carboxylesterase
MKENIRKYGSQPYTVALIHGGPGAAGEMGPVARVLSETMGVLEPLQTADSLEGQVEELRAVLEREASGPITLAGFSWGAWLAFILAARYPGLVRKLILIGSGPFEEKYVHAISETRFARLSPSERLEAGKLIELVEAPGNVPGRTEALERLGVLLSDAYDPEPDPDRGGMKVDPDIFRKVWMEAAELRRSGGLLACAGLIKCPVTAIHGDYDPHPAEGVKAPLERTLKKLDFILLKNCGHKPWIEKATKDKFYEVLKSELSS